MPGKPTHRPHCIFCSSPYHDYRRCPLAFKLIALRKITAKQEYTAQSPNIFVGTHGYPRVNVGFLNVEQYTEHDEPLKWSRENRQIPHIVGLRASLINSTYNQHIKRFSERLTAMAQEVSMAKRPADIELSLKKKPSFRTTFTQDAQPHGPNVPLVRARFTSNVATDQRVERVVDDTDLKAASGIATLYKRGVDEHRLTRLLSIGNLGVRAQRKLVPTRWSITAVDDTVGKQLIAHLKRFPEGNCTVHTGGYLGNEYVIMLFDDVWSYELFEGYLPRLKAIGNEAWETDYEPYEGRKSYAEETAGGYYAARLAILEALARRRRQAAVLALRFVTQEYSVPLGVWVVREAVRKAMQSAPRTFPDRAHMLRFVLDYCRQYFVDCRGVLAKSKLLRKLKSQTKLNQWV
ncbi:hypothetical protein D6789_03140 [Candidatus Woesearchaeota archaeon]|nr:MAG: hypothetical protein D6789_03140 [Candidatus Woesearchaeota archaeon]